MVNKSEWQLNYDKKQKKILTDRKKGIKSLTKEQLEVVEKAHRSLSDVLQNIYDMDDIYLSDIRELNTVMWKLKHEFDLENYNG